MLFVPLREMRMRYTTRPSRSESIIRDQLPTAPPVVECQTPGTPARQSWFRFASPPATNTSVGVAGFIATEEYTPATMSLRSETRRHVSAASVDRHTPPTVVT